MIIENTHSLVVGPERLDVDQLRVEALCEGAIRIVDEGNAPRHAGTEVAPGGPEDHHPTPGHVLAPVVADALHDRDGTRVAYAEPLAHLTPDENLAARRTVQDDVPGDDLVLGHEARLEGRSHHQTSS